MNSKFLLIAFSIAGFIGCTTSYKSGQTPDDVYYSPTRPYYDRSQEDSNVNTRVYQPSNTDNGNSTYHRRWRRHPNYDYGYYPGPEYGNVYIDPQTKSPTKYTAPRKVNTNAYKKSPPTTSKNPKTGKTSSAVGNFLREVINSAGTNSTSTSVKSSTQSGSSAPATSNPSPAKSPGTTTAPVRTFGNK